MSTLPTDPLAAMQFVAGAHDESQAAFKRLVAAPADNAVRRELHRAYRETTSRLLQVLHEHNESGMAPSPWNLTIVAQPLVQQTMIEADIVDALGFPAEATRLRQWAVEVAGRELPPLAHARFRLSVVNQHAAEGRFNEALAEFADLRRLFAEAGDVTQTAQTTLDEVVLLEWLGDYDRALETLKTARALLTSHISRELSRSDQTAQPFDMERRAIMQGMGLTGQGLGLTGDVGQAAAELLRRAALDRASVELVEHEARIHKARGQDKEQAAKSALGVEREARLREAREEYEAAASLWEGVIPHYASIGGAQGIEYQLAAIDRARGRPVEARARLDRIEPAFASGLFSGKVAGLRQLQAWVALDLGEPERALDLANKGLAELEAHPDEDLAWRLQWRRAAALRALDRRVEALEAYIKAAAKVDSLRKSPLGYRLDSTSLRAKLPVIEEGIALATEQRDGAACLRLIEVIKARALSSALSVPAPARSQRSDLETEFDTVTQRLDVLEYQGLTGAADGAVVRQERAALLERRIALMEEIRLRDPRWRGLTAPPPFEPAKLAAALKRRRQAGLTLYFRDGVVRSVLSVDGRFEVGQRTLGPDVVEILDDYASNLVVPNPDLHSRDPAALGLDTALFIPAELLEQALSATSLLVAPHGQLHLLPWPSMPFGTTRLFERVPIGVVPNMTCALVLETAMANSPRAALTGAATYPRLSGIKNLPGVGRELGAVEALYTGRLVAPPLLNEAATESAVRALATRADATSAILHIACHGTLSVGDPLGSGVLLPNGKIDAAEWAQMRLQYDEVVLSACSTGWRPMTAQNIVLHGDDVLGLPGALLEAGARSIVVSIPQADDLATEAFMTAYHRRRASGVSPLVAFAQTQREMLASDHEPHTWSGLVCYGVQ
jgi:CHAT domain-containing protein/tetratricopeptide (TPR) repeat protein